jgi:hypothetical protein
MYTVSLLQDHAILKARFWEGMGLVQKHIPFFAALPVLALVLAVTRKLSARGALWFGMFAVSFPSSLLPFAKVGGFANDFMPTCFFVGPAVVFLVVDAVRALRQRPRLALAAHTAACLGLCAYFFLATYDFKRFAPDENAHKRAHAAVKRVAELDGGVICPRNPFLPIRLGKRSDQFVEMPYLDMALAGYKELALGAYIDRTRARWAVVSGQELTIVADEIAKRYQLDRRFPDPPRMIIGNTATLRYLLRWQDDERKARVLFDFEGPLEGWEATGDAFEVSPVKIARPRGQAEIHGAVGEKLATSNHPKKRDAATGTLTSPPFEIDRPNMAFRIGGGWKSKTRVELVIGSQTVRKAQAIFEGNESMIKVVWDVKPFAGRTARFVLVDEDEDKHGHVNCDHVVLY